MQRRPSCPTYDHFQRITPGHRLDAVQATLVQEVAEVQPLLGPMKPDGMAYNLENKYVDAVHDRPPTL